MPINIKVGDKVKVVRLAKDAEDSETHKEVVGKTFTVREISPIYIYFHEKCPLIKIEEVEKVAKQTIIICDQTEE